MNIILPEFIIEGQEYFKRYDEDVTKYAIIGV
jgi:hypothetical protein